MLKNSTNSELGLLSIGIISGFSLFGICMFGITSYILWECWLKDEIEEIILNYFCCGMGEYILNCIECIGCINDWKKELEKKKDNVEFYGLTPHQISVIKHAKQINKIKLEEAIKIRWEEIAKYAVRPNDEYHDNLLNINTQKINEEIPQENLIEIEEDKKENEFVVNISGTPRRRKIIHI